MAIKVELVAPFVTSAAEVLRAETGAEVVRGNLRLDTGGIHVDGIAAMISLLGQVEGLVMFSMSTSTCLNVVARMVGEQFDELNELVQSGIAELSNVMAGRSATKLSNAGMFADISVPSLIIGRDVTISVLKLARLVVPLETEMGTVELHLAVREK